MKILGIVIIIIIGIAVYFFFNQFLAENLPNYLTLPKENNPPISKGSASVYNPEKTAEQTEKQNEEQKQEIKKQTKDIGEVKISYISERTYYHPSLITLQYRIKYGEKLNIAGWKIMGRQGEIIIPKAIEKYQADIDAKDILLSGFGTIYLIGDENPLGRNKNFCLNKCLGYLKEYNDFYPSFYTYCPKPKLGEISHLSPWCQEFILNLSSCEVPDYSNNPKIATDSQCTAFLRDNFNYNSCFQKYNQDKDFLENTWYLYTKTDIANPLHDTILLYDQSNTPVDKYVY